MKANEIAKDIIVETLDLSIKSFSEIGVTAMETNENIDNATKKIEQYKNKCVIEELEKVTKTLLEDIHNPDVLEIVLEIDCTIAKLKK